MVTGIEVEVSMTEQISFQTHDPKIVVRGIHKDSV